MIYLDRLFERLKEKFYNFIDPFTSLFGFGTKGSQKKLNQLLMKSSLEELETFLHQARLHKLNFDIVKLLELAKTLPATWRCLNVIAERKALTRINWHEGAPTALSKLAELAMGNASAQEF